MVVQKQYRIASHRIIVVKAETLPEQFRNSHSFPAGSTFVELLLEPALFGEEVLMVLLGAVKLRGRFDT